MFSRRLPQVIVLNPSLMDEERCKKRDEEREKASSKRRRRRNTIISTSHFLPPSSSRSHSNYKVHHSRQTDRQIDGQHVISNAIFVVRASNGHSSHRYESDFIFCRVLYGLCRHSPRSPLRTLREWLYWIKDKESEEILKQVIKFASFCANWKHSCFPSIFISSFQLILPEMRQV